LYQSFIKNDRFFYLSNDKQNASNFYYFISICQ
jgi:hypothetical protein